MLCQARAKRVANTSTPRPAQRAGYSTLFCGGERFVEPRFATIGCVFVNDSAFRSFIDCREQRANLIRAGGFRRAHCFLHRPQACYNAAIAKRTFRFLAGALGG
jgi:hypothetical protein